jgi:hypothetical protein
MVKSLLYSLKLSVIPIVALIGGKLTGLWLAGSLLGVKIGWDFTTPASFLNPAVAASDSKNVLSFANLVMFALLAIGMSIVLIQSSYFHDSHLDVSIVSKLADMNLLNLVRSTYELYHWGFIWVVYLFIASLVILVDVTLNRTEVWVVVISFAFSLFSILILIKDAYNEVQIAKSLTERKNYERE